MAISFQERASFYTESANAVPQVNAAQFGIVGRFLMPTTIASEQVLFEMSSGADLSRVTLSLTTDLKTKLEISNAAGTTTNVTAGSAWSVGWHTFMVYAPSSGNILHRVDNSAVIQAASGGRPNSALTRLTLGCKRDGTMPSESAMRWLHCCTNSFDATEITALGTWDGTANLAATINGETAIIPFENTDVATLGTVAWVHQREPIFIDDPMTVSWAQSAFDAIPAVRNANVLYDNANVDLMLFSDSFGAPFAERLAFWMASEYARMAGVGIKKLANGARTRAHATDSPIVTTELIGGTGLDDDVADSNNYAWNLDITPVQMAIPMDWGLDMAFPAGTTGTYIASVSGANPASYSGPIAEWMDDDTYGVKLLLRRGCNFRAYDNSTLRDSITFSGSGAIPWASPEILLSEDNSGGRLLNIAPPSGGFAGIEDEAFQIIGSIWENKDIDEGVGYLSIAGGSWSVGGHYANAASSGGTPKQYLDTEINPVIAAFNDSSRKLIFVMSIATESSMNTTVAAWITKMRARCTTLGITNYGFLIVSQFVHTDRATVRTSVTDFDTIAQANPDVCHVSIYKLTKGCFFHDNLNSALGPNTANTAQEYFLDAYDLANGTDYDTTPGRTMLDASDLHLSGVESGRFMGEIMARGLFQSGELAADPASNVSGKQFSLGLSVGI